MLIHFYMFESLETLERLEQQLNLLKFDLGERCGDGEIIGLCS